MAEHYSIMEADPADSRSLDDLLTVLNAYKSEGMGEGVPYSEQELTLLKGQFNSSPSVLVFLVYAGDAIAGASVCFKTFSTFSAANVLNVHDLCILREFRGKGLGRGLMQAIIEKGRELLCSKITLEVREDNGIAQDLYKSLDFGESQPVMRFWRKML